MIRNSMSPAIGKRWAVAGGLLLLCALVLLASRWASSGIDTSGFKPPAQVTAQDLEKQIQGVRDDARIPASQKENIISMMRARANTDRSDAPKQGKQP